MKTEKDDFLLGLTFFLVVLDSKNTLKAKKNNFEYFLIGAFASEKNQPQGKTQNIFFNGSYVYGIQKKRIRNTETAHKVLLRSELWLRRN